MYLQIKGVCCFEAFLFSSICWLYTERIFLCSMQEIVEACVNLPVNRTWADRLKPPQRSLELGECRASDGRPLSFSYSLYVLIYVWRRLAALVLSLSSLPGECIMQSLVYSTWSQLHLNLFKIAKKCWFIFFFFCFFFNKIERFLIFILYNLG